MAELDPGENELYLQHLQCLGILEGGDEVMGALAEPLQFQKLQKAIASSRCNISNDQLQQLVELIRFKRHARITFQEHQSAADSGCSLASRNQQCQSSDTTAKLETSGAQNEQHQFHAEEGFDHSSGQLQAYIIDASSDEVINLPALGLVSAEITGKVLREVNAVAVENAELSPGFIAARHLCLKSLLAEVRPCQHYRIPACARCCMKPLSHAISCFDLMASACESAASVIANLAAFWIHCLGTNGCHNCTFDQTNAMAYGSAFLAFCTLCGVQQQQGRSVCMCRIVEQPLHAAAMALGICAPDQQLVILRIWTSLMLYRLLQESYELMDMAATSVHWGFNSLVVLLYEQTCVVAQIQKSGMNVACCVIDQVMVNLGMAGHPWGRAARETGFRCHARAHQGPAGGT